MTTDLVTWFRAQLDVTEQAIRQDGVHPGQPHTDSVELDPNGEGYGEYSECERCQLSFREYRLRNPYANHEFGLADVKAKRQIVDLCEEAIRYQGHALEDGQGQLAEDILRLLADAVSRQET